MASIGLALGLLGIEPVASSPDPPASPGARRPEAICEHPNDAAAFAGSGRTPEGHLAAQDWLANERAQAAVNDINAVARGFQDVVVGVSRDHGRRAVLVVVDSTASAERVSSLRAEVERRQPRLTVEIRSSCRPKSHLDAAVAELARGSSVVAERGTYAFAIDPTRGRVSLLVSEQRLADEFDRRHGDVVDIAVVPDIGRDIGGRGNDRSPHYGDANIGGCSSNFSYTHNVYGVRVSATAGHCGPLNSHWYSGGNYYGQMNFRSFPDPDVAMLYAAGQNYTNVIYTDPCCPSTRSVIGKVNPGVNNFVCHGGAQSLAQCGIEIINTNAQYCDAGACSNNLTQLFRLGEPDFALDGDSGGVVYQRSGSNGALAAGLHIASAGPVFGGYTSWHHKISTVEATMQVTLLTVP